MSYGAGYAVKTGPQQNGASKNLPTPPRLPDIVRIEIPIAFYHRTEAVVR